jgi:uncharacterized membrane protein
VDLLSFLVLLVCGFTACAEFGSWAFVHPVVRELPPASHLRVEQGFLRTFGRVMPVLMPLSTILAVLHAITATGAGPAAVRWTAAAAFVVAVVLTVVVNVPVNTATARWNPDDPPPDWAALRRRWERSQGLRASALLIGFALLCASATLA